MVTVVIAAGGKGRRMGAGENKVFMKLRGREVIAHTAKAFQDNPLVDEIIIVAGEGEHRRISEIMLNAGISKMRSVTTGGKTRQESVKNGIAFANGDIILIHDGARALISQEEISAVIADAKKYGAAAVGVKVKDTLKSSENGFITGTLDRETTYHIQTPQAFKRDIILSAHDMAKDNTATDDCALVEAIGIRIKITEGKYDNIKLTTPEDMEIAEKILEKRKLL